MGRVGVLLGPALFLLAATRFTTDPVVLLVAMFLGLPAGYSFGRDLIWWRLSPWSVAFLLVLLALHVGWLAA
jgi:hypothetical protein